MISVEVDPEDVIIQPLQNSSIDITGNKVGEGGEIIGYAGKSDWYIKCGCGIIFKSKTSTIKGSNSKPAIVGCYKCSNTRKKEKSHSEMVGRRFGRIEVICCMEPEKKKHKAKYFCKCDCGNFCSKRGFGLLAQGTESCGCLRMDVIRLGPDMVGKKFNRLEVIEYIGVIKNNCRILCKCDCGKIKQFNASSVFSERTQSCGCLRNERAAKCARERLTGKMGPLAIGYRHDIPDSDRLKRRSMNQTIYRGLSSRTFKRDNYRCQKCGCNSSKKNEFNAHHIRNYKDYEPGVTDPDNLITFCANCHMDFHSKYGKKNNNESQIEEFIGYKWPLAHLIYDPIYLGI